MNRLLRPISTAVPLFAAVMLAACGGHGDDGAASSAPPPERAYLAAMVPHHEAALAMARVAERRGESSSVRRLGKEIVAAQAAEIAQMRRLHERLFRAPLRPDPAAHAALGLSASEAGMDHGKGASDLAGQRPFDPAFVGRMIPHHEGAIRMSQAVLPKTRDAELRRLAEGIVAVQREEIAVMRRIGGGAASGGHGAGTETGERKPAGGHAGPHG